MACPICSSVMCREHYHSVRERENYYGNIPQKKITLKGKLKSNLEKLNTKEFDGNNYVKVEDVISLINDIDWLI